VPCATRASLVLTEVQEAHGDCVYCGLRLFAGCLVDSLFTCACAQPGRRAVGQERGWPRRQSSLSRAAAEL
jgi:hypothetical protein